MRSWRDIIADPLTVNHGLVGSINSHGLWSWGIVTKPHLLLEVDLGLLVGLLPVLELPVPLVDEVITSCDVIMPVVLDALLGVLPIEVELSDNLFEQLILNWHLLFAREHSLVSEFVLHLKRPSVVSDVVH